MHSAVPANRSTTTRTKGERVHTAVRLISPVELEGSARGVAGVGTVHFFVLSCSVEVPVSKRLPHSLTFDLVAIPALVGQRLAMYETGVQKHSIGL